MNGVGLRLAIVVLICLVLYALIWLVRLFVAKQRRRALDADPVSMLPELSPEEAGARVRILVFSSEDCRQCHTLQAPALRRVQATFGEKLVLTEIDAPSSPELTRRYHVLTVPTTVLLDATAKAHTINYGFTNAHSISRQVEEILSLDRLQEALP
jgi:thioredoxin-related protein